MFGVFETLFFFRSCANADERNNERIRLIFPCFSSSSSSYSSYCAYSFSYSVRGIRYGNGAVRSGNVRETMRDGKKETG